MDHPLKEGGLFISDLYLKNFFFNFMQNYLDFSLFFVIFVLKLKIRRNLQFYIKKIIFFVKKLFKIFGYFKKKDYICIVD